MYEEIKQSLERLLLWLKNSGYKGYDPYDIWENKIALYSARYGSERLSEGVTLPIARILRGLIYYLDKFFPGEFRTLLSIERRINAKGMGLFASSFLNIYKITGNKLFLNESKQILKWLIRNVNRNFGGFGWGYPFNWQSLEYIPRNTPSSVATSVVGEAFYEYWLLTKEKWVKNIIKKINEFFISGLNIDYISKNELCFSYTPLDLAHVHNANLFVTDFLLKTYKITKDERQLELAQKSLNYTLKLQNSDGSFYYYGEPEKVSGLIDHYHTGFIINSLRSIWDIKKEERVRQSLKKCLNHYLKNLFFKGIPKIKTTSLYPIDIHSLAVAIITLVRIENYNQRINNYLKRTINFTIKEFQDNKGYFYYRIEKVGPIKWKVKFPYLRWAEAWMLLALTEYLKIYSQRNKLIIKF